MEPVPSTSAVLPLTLPNGFDRTTFSELLLSVHNFLQQSDCPEAANTLRDEIERRSLLVPCPNLLEDNLEPNTFTHFQNTHRNVIDLLPLISRLNDVTQNILPLPTPLSTIRLSAAPQFSIARTSTLPGPSPVKTFLPTAVPYHLKGLSTKNRLQTIRLGGHVPKELLLSKKLQTDYRRHTRIMGHKAAVYCITFDRSGKYLITGADDNLIKVWNVQSCMLRYTYRGHSGEICDLAVSHENTLLASGSNDKTVRIWSMQRGSALNVFKQHTGQLSSVCFPDFFQGGVRYLVSVATDCSVIFYRWISETREFLGPGERFVHKEGGAARLFSAAYSSGGNFAAFAGSQKTIYIYMLEIEGAKCIATLKDVHGDQIDTLVWSNRNLKFVSAGHDGRVLLWDFLYNTWKGQELKIPEKDMTAIIAKLPSKKNVYRAYTATWNLDDSFVLTTGSDNYIRIFNSKTGDLVSSLRSHDKVAYIMRAHPINPDLVFTAGYDGICFIWDLSNFTCINKIVNKDDTSKNQSIYDATISPDGSICAFADDNGCITINGIQDNDKAKRVPKQQFFTSDYHPCINDPNGFAIDSVTGLAPHLCNPPLLERSDNIPYADEWQRYVPGRISMLQSDEDDPPPGGFCPWITNDIMAPTEGIEEVIRTANFESIHLQKNYELEVKKKPPADWKCDPISPIKPPARPRLAVPEAAPPPISPDVHQGMIDFTDSEDGTYSGPSESESEADDEENNLPDDPLLYDDDNDSDYFEGYHGHDTVHRDRIRRRRRVHQDPIEEVHAANPPLEASRRSTRERRSPGTAEHSDASASANRRSNVRHTRANPVVGDEQPISRGRRRRYQPVNRNENGSRNDSPVTTPQPDNVEGTLELQFPQWMLQDSPRRFPYIPQLGDCVVYFPQGHIAYLNKLRKEKLCFPNIKDYPKPYFNPDEFAIVEKVDYAIFPYRHVSIILGLTDASGRKTGETMKAWYHDFPSVPDYIILRELYDRSLAFDFKQDDRVEGIIDEKWWQGTVINRKYDGQGDFNGSQLSSVEINWDNGDNDICSPWDFQPLTSRRVSEISATIPEQEMYSSYTVKMADWLLPPGAPDAGRNPELARDHYFQKLNTAIQQFNSVRDADPFQHPVDLAVYPDYPSRVAYPVHFQIITERLMKKYYRTLLHLKLDIQLIAKNAITYNRKNSTISVNSMKIVETLFHIIENATPPNAATYYNSLADTPQADLNAYKKDLSLHQPRRNRNPQVSATPSNSTTSQPTAVKKTPQDIWMEECRTAVTNLLTNEAMEHFDDPEELNAVFESFNEKEYESPMQYLEALTSIIASQINRVGRRSTAHRDLNKITTELELKFKPIKEKFDRMQKDKPPRERRLAAINASQVWRTGRSRAGRELRTRTAPGQEQYTRRSTRYHPDTNYADLDRGDISDFEDYKPGPSVRRPKSETRSPLQGQSSDNSPAPISPKREAEDEDAGEEDSLPAQYEPLVDEMPEVAIPSSPSIGQENDSDFVGDEELESDNDEEEDEGVRESPLPSESEETAVSTDNSDDSTRPRSKKRRGKVAVAPRRRPRGRQSTESGSSIEVRKSTRKRKANRRISPDPPIRKKPKTENARPVRSTRGKAVHYCDDDDSDPESEAFCQTTRSRRTAVQRRR